MGVSLPQGGGKRSMNADLNLVPFIDLMSTLITFLLATAVWVQQSALEVEQAIGDPPPREDIDTPPVPPLMLHIRSDAVWLGRSFEGGKLLPVVSGEYDWAAVERELDADRAQYPTETQITIRTDDGLYYEHMIKALDLSRGKGYDKTLLAGGPPSVVGSN